MWGIGIRPLIYYITQETPKEYHFRLIFYHKILSILTLSSHHVTSCVTVRTTEIELNSGAIVAKKKQMTSLKSVTLKLE